VLIVNFAARLALVAGLAASMLMLGVSAPEAQQRRAVGTIWIDPDGCEHWVRDDGWEGYASNRLDRMGKPVCHAVETCAVMNTDQLFATDSYKIHPQGRDHLAGFFRSAGARAYKVIGHTDSRASDAYNLRLSYNRANAVAQVAAGVGAPVLDVSGYGERQPKASNSTAAGMQANRRVEIICIR